MRIIFAGTTDFGIPTLERLKSQYEMPFVISQPDRPFGRDKTLTPPPIKVWAQENGIPVHQPEKLSTIIHQLSAINPDILLVAAYGQIIPKQILDLPKFGSINIHGSLLPKYRGATPVHAAILNGDIKTGITLIIMDALLDHGPIIAAKEVEVNPKETFTSLYRKLSDISADLVSRTLPKWFKHEIKLQEQDESKATYTKLFNYKVGKINWTDLAINIERKIRALNPQPSTWTTLGGKSVKILAAEVVSDNKIELPGKLYTNGKFLMVKCQDTSLRIETIQPEGKKPMSGKDFLNGIKNLETKIFI